jgi:SAM-dependent methyltransferase
LTKPEENRFEDFFNDDFYVSLKNHLYNYRLRREAVRKWVRFEEEGFILEVGSGLSPMLEVNDRVVYSDLSLSALGSLKRTRQRGLYIAADAVSLPFKNNSFSTVVCSEVLEHLPDDVAALREIARVMTPNGALILTVPHRRFYFANDDRFVNHYRRYEINEIEEKLKDAGLETSGIQKVLGPLEKITMITVVFFVSSFSRFKRGRAKPVKSALIKTRVIAPVFKMFNLLYSVLVRFDARIFPRKLASVILFKAKKRGNRTAPFLSDL